MNHLVTTHLLDPRGAAVARARPIRASVNIPAAEIAGRAFELPPRGVETAIADVGEAGDAAVGAFAAMHRPCRTTREFHFADGSTTERYRLWQPAAWLERSVHGLPPGRALDLACGSGRESVYLAALGWDVLGVDVLPDALDQARALAERYTPGAPVRFERRDLEAGPVALVDRFDLIVGFRYLHRPLFALLATWAAPGARVIYETFTTEHRARHGKPSRDAHLLKPTELPGLLCGWDVQAYEEGWRGDAHTARVVARLRDWAE